MVLGRLFTASADAIAAAVWLTEGLSGAVARRRCLPGEWPALAAAVEIRVKFPNADGTDSPAGSPSAPAPAAPPAKPPSLQSILQAVAEVALSTAISESASLRSAGAAAFRRGGGAPSLSSQADALDMSASVASPRLAMLLLFVAFQVSRTGPGVPPIVQDSPAAASSSQGTTGVIASAVRLAALYLCSPAPSGQRVAGVGGGDGAASTSAAGCLSDSSWVLHDGVVEALVSFTNRCASVAAGAAEAPPARECAPCRRTRDSKPAAWDVHSDDEVFGLGLLDSHDASQFPRTARGAVPSEPQRHAGAALSRREELLVRLLRSVPLSPDLRAVLAVRAGAAGLFAALAVLRALEGDVVAVMAAFLQVRWLRRCGVSGLLYFSFAIKNRLLRALTMTWKP